jgi:hypothetical protein
LLAEPGPDVPELPVVSTTKPFTIAQLRRQIEHSLSVAPA